MIETKEDINETEGGDPFKYRQLKRKAIAAYQTAIDAFKFRLPTSQYEFLILFFSQNNDTINPMEGTHT